MSSVSDGTVELISLVKAIDTWNSQPTRIEAIKKLGELGVFSRLAVDGLQRIVSKEQHTEVGKLAQESLDMIYLSGQMKKPMSRSRTLLTNVKITSEVGNGLEIENSKTYCKCNFCGKETVVNEAVRRFTTKLSGPDRFYCCFCLRHKLNHRDSRHTLLLTFRSIIGYYYYGFYFLSKNVHMTISEINDYIAMHVKAGLQNPLFLYDPETYLWYIDFTRIGTGRRKLPIEDVLGTIVEILLSFSLLENVKDIKPCKMYAKYEEAILKFYHQRHRPTGARVLSPTLVKTGASEYAAEKLAKYDPCGTSGSTINEKRRIDPEATRTFSPEILQEAMGKKY